MVIFFCTFVQYKEISQKDEKNLSLILDLSG